MEARIDNFNGWVNGVDEGELKTSLEALIKTAGFTILNFMEHSFEPQGYTAIWLLAESHCALHTFPEADKSYIELSSCNVEMYESFIEKMEVYFNRVDNH